MKRTSVRLLASTAAGLAAVAVLGGPASAAPAPAYLDLDGDGRTDYAVAQQGFAVTWAPAASPATRERATFYAGSVPVEGRFLPTAGSQLGGWDPFSASWTIPTSGGISTFTYGREGDLEVVGNYLPASPTDEIAVFRPSTGQWFVRGQAPVGFGRLGDIPVPADYDGDGTTDIAVFRPETGQWFVRGQGAPVGFGRFGDVPVPADYDGDGDDDLAVARRGTAMTWYVRGQAPVTYGRGEDVPVPGDYDGNGTADRAVYRFTSRGVVENRYFVQGRSDAPAITGVPVDESYPAQYVYVVIYGD